MRGEGFELSPDVSSHHLNYSSIDVVNAKRKSADALEGQNESISLVKHWDLFRCHLSVNGEENTGGLINVEDSRRRGYIEVDVGVRRLGAIWCPVFGRRINGNEHQTRD